MTASAIKGVFTAVTGLAPRTEQPVEKARGTETKASAGVVSGNQVLSQIIGGGGRKSPEHKNFAAYSEARWFARADMCRSMLSEPWRKCIADCDKSLKKQGVNEHVRKATISAVSEFLYRKFNSEESKQSETATV